MWLSRAKGKYEYWLTEDGLILLSAWARDGATDEDIAKNIGIAPATLYEWKKRFPEISEALKKNKELADIVIENELYESCKGRTVTIKKPIKVKKVRVLSIYDTYGIVFLPQMLQGLPFAGHSLVDSFLVKIPVEELIRRYTWLFIEQALDVFHS